MSFGSLICFKCANSAALCKGERKSSFHTATLPRRSFGGGGGSYVAIGLGRFFGVLGDLLGMTIRNGYPYGLNPKASLLDSLVGNSKSNPLRDLYSPPPVCDDVPGFKPFAIL